MSPSCCCCKTQQRDDDNSDDDNDLTRSSDRNNNNNNNQQALASPSRSCFSPTLSLLQSPIEYLITINHSSLWQRHIAWAKPDGHELRQYISSQYSTNMVLLSLLLGIQINVFFNSNAEEMIHLRDILSNNPTHGHSSIMSIYTSLLFWIGFLILLNISVTIMGIIATFTSWSMITAISNANTHALLRSSLGQYITTLSPRLIVASLYLFLFWIILFIIDMVSWMNPLLWILVLSVIIMMFVYIVVPLSEFGRIILHTGAMSSKAILKQELETQLLPNGLYASLVIKAYHQIRKNVAVTNQYHHIQNRRTGEQQQEHQDESGNIVEAEFSSRQDTTNQHQHHPSVNSDGTLFASDDDDDDDDASLNEQREEIKDQSPSSSLLDIEWDPSTSTAKIASGKSTGATKRQSQFSQPSDLTDPVSKSKNRRATSIAPKNASRHQRNQTAESTLFLPPAAILNMSLSGKEFQELINNTIDTSSIGEENDDGGDNTSRRIFRNSNNGSILVSTKGGARHADDGDRHALPPTYPTSQSASTKTFNVTDGQIQISTSTKHHRRVSSSRFLLHEWAQENSVRDLYGIDPPADLPNEIALIGNGEGEDNFESSPRQRFSSNSISPSLGPASTPRWSPSIWNRSNNNQNWFLSSFSLDTNDEHSPSGIRDRNGADDARQSRKNDTTHMQEQNGGLTQPLLPIFDSTTPHAVDAVAEVDNDDEETGSSTLLGEDFLPSTSSEGRRKTIKASNLTQRQKNQM